MEVFKAQIKRDSGKATLVLKVKEKPLEIVLTEDKPNAIKEVFNSLLIALKDGEFNFELEDSQEDLYFHICKEYLKQLNSELTSVYKELQANQLLST